MPRLVPDKSTKQAKVVHVKSQGQTRKHHCHWPGCQKQVPPAMWGCYQHWMKLPKQLRDRVWAEYSIGQEKTLTPSKEYLAVVEAVEDWIRDAYSCVACEGSGESSSGKECSPCNGSGVKQ